MKGRLFLLLAILLAALAVGIRFYPFDRQPPGVSVSPPPGLYNEVVRFTMESEEGAALFYAIGDAQPLPYIGPVTLRRDARITYFARDRAGNQSPAAVAAYLVRLDIEPPLTVASPPGGKFGHPVSLRLSSEEGAVIRYTLDGTDPTEASAVYSSGLALRQDATVRFFATDQAGNREEVRTEVYVIQVDTTKPVTLADPSGGVFRSPVTVRLAAEEGSRIYYTLDGKRPDTGSARYDKAITFARSGVLRFFAVDGAGNREDMREERYVIDTVPPSLKADPPAGTFGRPVSVRLLSSEPGEIRYEIGTRTPGSSSTLYRAPIQVGQDTTLTAVAVDQAGNRSEVLTAGYVIDRTPPQVTARPPGGNYSGRIRVKLETSEPADVFYTLDGSAPSRQSTRYVGPVSVERNSTLSFFGVDGVGNAGKAASERYIMDQEAPVTTVDPAGGVYTGPFDVSLRSEDGAVIRYTTDGATPSESSTVYRGPLRISRNTVLKFYATDDSGNRETVREERYNFDTTPPTTTIDPSGGFFNRPVSISLRSEKGGKIFYRTGKGGEFAVYGGPFVIDRSGQVSFYSVDPSGNREAVQVAEYVIDNDPPVTVPYPAPGEYNPPITLELRTEPGARIHYTLDGSLPSESSPVFKAPVSLREAFTAKFFAVDQAGNREAVKSVSFLVASGLWRRNTNGVFLHPSVLDGDFLWIGGEEGLFKVNVDSKRRINYTTRDGLISNSIRALAVDRLGFIWVGTDKGLCQFDGKKNWVTYDYSDGLPSNQINCIVVDALDRIWIGTDKGLAVFADKVFRTMTTADGLPDNRVNALAIDPDATFWVATEKGLWRYRGSDRRVISTADGLPADELVSVAVDGRWNVWVGTRDQGVARLDGTRWIRYGAAEGVRGRKVSVIAVDLADNKWFGTDAGVLKYDGKSFTPVSAPVYR